MSEKFIQQVYPKSKAALDRIKQSIENVALIQDLNQDQQTMLIGAMFEKRCQKGDEIISQGDHGDFFYVIESGVYEVWKSDNIKPPYTQKKKIFQYDHSGSCGELALINNAPRSATVMCVTNGILWAVDRSTFQHIMRNKIIKQKKEEQKDEKDNIKDWQCSSCTFLNQSHINKCKKCGLLKSQNISTLLNSSNNDNDDSHLAVSETKTHLEVETFNLQTKLRAEHRKYNKLLRM
eukprot:122818_1